MFLPATGHVHMPILGQGCRTNHLEHLDAKRATLEEGDVCRDGRDLHAQIDAEAEHIFVPNKLVKLTDLMFNQI